MEIGRHTAQAASAVGHHELRRVEGLSRLQPVLKEFRIYSAYGPHGIHLVHLDLHGKVAAVNQGQSVTAAVFLRRVRRAQNHTGIVLMAGGASPASHLHRPMHQRKALQPSLHGVPPVEMNRFPGAVRQFQTGGHHLLQPDRLLSSIGDSGGAGDHIAVRKYDVVQLQFQRRRRVLQEYHQRFRRFILIEQARQPRNLIGPLPDLPGDIAEVGSPCSVRLTHTHTVVPVIPHSIGGKFLRQRIQGKCSVLPRLVRISGKSHIFSVQQVIHGTVLYPCAIVEMKQNPVIACLHLISRPFRLKRKYLFCLIHNDSHNLISL